MAQFYTLEEAARHLGMSPEELKQKAQKREIQAFQDAGTWQFKVSVIEELARKRGLGSDPDVSLSELELPAASSGSDELDLLSEFQIDASAGSGSASSSDDLLGDVELSVADADVRIDDLSLPPELGGSSSTIIGMKPTGKRPTDSDIKLVPDEVMRTASDSDVRLAPLPRTASRSSDSDVTLVADDSVELPVMPPVGKPKSPLGAGSGSSAGDAGATTLARSPLLDAGDELGMDVAGSNSDFELTPSSVIDALQPDSGSDFELTSLDSSDDDYTSGPASKSVQRTPSESDVTAVEASASGVNLMRPSDSGINLAAPSLDLGEADSIELAPLDDDEPVKAPAKPATPPKKAASAASSVVRPPAAQKGGIQPDDPGATALPMKLGGDKDIFDDTDFEVDAVEAGDDRTVQLEASSDFEIDESESASEVFAIDEDDVDENAATTLGAAPAIAAEDDDAFSGISSGEQEAAGWGDVSSDEQSAVPAAAAAAAGAAAGAAAATAAAPAVGPRGSLLTTATGPDWHPGWVAAVILASLLALMGLFVGHDLVVNLNEFRGNGPASGLVSWIAGLMG